MWKVRETDRIGVKVFYEVYKELPAGTVFKGRYTYEKEAQALADKLNREEGYYERV